MRSAWLLTVLDACPQADEMQLREWIKAYGDLDVCAEVYLRLVNRNPRLDEQERLALLREAIARYPRYNRINVLKNQESNLLSPVLSLVMNEVYPGSPMQIEVTYRNLPGISFKLYRVNLPVESASLAQVNAKTIAKYGK
jgi:hypothetical protein